MKTMFLLNEKKCFIKLVLFGGQMMKYFEKSGRVIKFREK